MTNVNYHDKAKVLAWMQKYCQGFRNARVRANILPFMQGFSDRHWRACVSELKHEGHLASTSSRGYWAIPPATRDKEEVEAALESCKETKSKALDMLTGVNKLIEALQDKKSVLTRQVEMFA